MASLFVSAAKTAMGSLAALVRALVRANRCLGAEALGDARADEVIE
jgi:hypothetical protein